MTLCVCVSSWLVPLIFSFFSGSRGEFYLSFCPISFFFFLDMSVLKDIESVLTDYVKEYQGVYIYKVNKGIL